MEYVSEAKAPAKANELRRPEIKAPTGSETTSKALEFTQCVLSETTTVKANHRISAPGRDEWTAATHSALYHRPL